MKYFYLIISFSYNTITDKIFILIILKKDISSFYVYFLCFTNLYTSSIEIFHWIILKTASLSRFIIPFSSSAYFSTANAFSHSKSIDLISSSNSNISYKPTLHLNALCPFSGSGHKAIPFSINHSIISGVISLIFISLCKAAGFIVKIACLADIYHSENCSLTLTSIFASSRIFLHNLCATITLKVPVTIYGFAHRLMTLVIVSDAELVCTVENTKCQVIAASIAVCNVSKSRISHTMIISGSCLNAALNHEAKVNPMSDLTCD